MRKIYLIILYCVLCSVGYTARAQMNSENGWITSPKGVMRVFVVFAEIDYTACGGTDPYINSMGTNPEWAAGSLPTFANQLFDTDYTSGTIPTNKVSEFFYQQSLGNYVVLGDYYPSVVTIPCNSATSGATTEIISYLNSRTTPILSNSGKTLNDFDLQVGSSFGLTKPAGSDNIIDNIIIIWRNNIYLNGGGLNAACGSGFGLWTCSASGSKQIQSPTVTDPNYNPNYKSSVANSASFRACHFGDAFMMIKAEYFHALFGDNNWHSAGGGGIYSFLSAPQNYALSSQGGTSQQVCGWDRNHLGWYGWDNLARTVRKSNLISAKNTSNTEVSTDLTIANNSSGGQFVLRDFHLYGDAVRIKLPFINYTTAGDVKNQYLWIENHQKLTPAQTGFNTLYDFIGNNSSVDACTNNTPVGMFAYVQVGKDAKSATNISSSPNELGSWLFPLPAEGRYDFKYRYDLAQPAMSGCANWNNANLPVDKSSSQTLPNPFTGFSDLFQIAPSTATSSNFSSRIYVGLSEILTDGSCHNTDIPATSPNWVCHDWNGHGDGKDAFTSAIGKTLLNIGTNPSTSTVYTYTSDANASTYNYSGGSFASYENRKIYLNGLQVKILQENYNSSTFGPGAMLVEIKWDNYDIANDARWCGDILLQNNSTDPLSRTSQINLLANNTITLDQGKSPTKLINGVLQADGTYLFADTTRLKLQSPTITSLQSGAKIKVVNGSKLGIKSGATVKLYKNSQLIVDASSTICIENTSDIQFLDPTASITIGSNVYYGSLAAVNPISQTYANTTLPTGVTYVNDVTTGTNVINSTTTTTVLKAVNFITIGQGTTITPNSNASFAAFIQSSAFTNSCSSVTFRETPKHFVAEGAGPSPVNGSNSGNSTNSTSTAVNNDAQVVEIYPNPSDGNFSIHSINSNEAINTIEIMDITGRLLFTEFNKSNNSIVQINLSNLPEGFYFIKTNLSNGTSVTRKVVLKR